MAGIDGKSSAEIGVRSYVKSIGVGREKEFVINASVSGGLLLASEAIFSSSWHDTKDRDKIFGTVYTSGSGGIFQIEQTPDTGTFDPVSGSDFVGTQVPITNSIGTSFSVELISNYVRTKFINNSGSAQTAFRLYAFFTG